MAPRLRALLCASAALLAGCGEPVEPAVPSLEPPPPASGPAVPVPTATAQEDARPASTTPVLPPLAKDARPPCDIAKETRKGADLALGQGRSYRAVRLVEKADRQCPSNASLSWGTRLDALGKLGRDDAARELAKEITASATADATVATSARAVLAKAPAATPPSADTLLTSALAAQTSGALDARAKLDRALVRLEQETSKAPEPFLDTAERKPLAISNDGATVAVGIGNTVVLLDAKTLRPQRFFDGASPTAAAVLSADGKLLATVQSDAVDVFSATTSKRIHHLVWADEEPQAALFSSDGKRLIVGSERSFDAAIRVWNLETGDSTDSFTLPREGGVTTLGLSRDNKQIAIGTDRGTLQLWALSPHKLTASLAKKESFLEKVVSISFSPKGDKLAVFFGAGRLGTWETKLGKNLWEVAASDWFGEGVAAFSADGSRVLAGTKASFKTALREWDATTGAELQNKPTGVEPAFFSQDGHFALGADRDEIGVIDTVAGTEVTSSSAAPRARSLAFAPPRTILASLDGEKAFRLVRPQGIRQFSVEDTYGSAAVSVDGRSFAHANYRDVRVWDIDKGSPVVGYPALPDTSPTVRFGPQGNELRLWVSRFDALSGFAAAPGAPEYKKLFQLERKDLGRMHFSEYGRFAAIESDKKVFLLDTVDGTMKSAADDSQDRIREMEVSPDGTALFTVREERLTRFDTATGKATHGAIPLGCYVDLLSPSFDGSKVLAFCSERAMLFTYVAGQEGPTMTKIDVGRVTYEKIALAPQGDLIVSAHEDGSLRLWDAAGALRAELRPIAGADAMLVRSPAGRVLLTGKDAATIEEHLSCRVGPRAVPFVVCADALGDDDVLADAFAPGSP